MDCGKNFRSEKRKTDHTLSNCNAKDQQIEASDSTAHELDEEFGNIVHPDLELLQENHGNHQKSLVPEVSTKNCEQKSLIRPEKSDFHKDNDDLTNADQENVDSPFSKDSPANDCDGDVVNNGTKEWKIEAEISPPNLRKTSTVSTGNKCSYCYKEFNDEICLARHIENSHQPFTCDICGIAGDNRNQIRYHKVCRNFTFLAS